MKTLSLALRNLLRNRRRSIVTLLAMMVGLSAALIFGGYSGNSIYALQTGYVQMHGHLQIQRQGYFVYGSGNPAAYGIADYQHIIDIVKHDPVLAPMLTVVTPKLQLGGIAGNFAAGVSTNVLVSGIVVDEQNEMRKWDDYGSMNYSFAYPLTGTAPDAVVIGTGVARKLQLCAPLKVDNCRAIPAPPADAGPQAPDDIKALSALEARDQPAASQTRIELLAANVHGAPNVVGLNVVKAQNWGFKEFDDTVMVMHLAQAQRLIFGAGQAQVTAIQIQLRHTDQMASAKARLEQLLATTLKSQPLEILDFETLTPIYGQSVQFFHSVFGFIATLIGAIVLFTVGNTMSMAVVERTTEIGTLRAIGQRRSGIRRLFMLEGLLLGVIGAALGVLAGLVLANLINHSGLTWTPPGYVYAYPLRVRIWGDWGLLVESAAGLIAVAVVSAWWPANRASKLTIVDALRHV